MAQKEHTAESEPARQKESFYYRIYFRPGGRQYTACAHQDRFKADETVIVRTDHGPEPGVIVRRMASVSFDDNTSRLKYTINRDASHEERERYERLLELEDEAFTICASHIERLNLPMQLVRVERFFNGGKIIFYFTANNRVDFRELVKALVHNFRVRVEMRQIGVRHETQMLGGIGSCGRELCCSSFLDRFNSVSIKMAKEQDLPLNPAKISGVCNRLLCCLTYEFETYKQLKKGMPRAGRSIRFEGAIHRVLRQLPLQSSILVKSQEGVEQILSKEQWRGVELIKGGAKRTQRKKTPKKQGSNP